MDIPQLSPTEVAEKVKANPEIVFIDVREAEEIETARIEGTKWLPLSEIAMRSAEFDPSKETIVHCHHGMRSLQAAQFLKAKGFENISNMSGGIDQWSLDVDENVPRY